MDGNASITVVRPGTGRRDRDRAYEIVIDESPCGHLRRGTTLTMSVAPGRHVLRARIDWAGSKQLTLDLHAGDMSTVVVGPSSGFWRGLSRMFSKTNYLRLDLVTDE